MEEKEFLINMKSFFEGIKELKKNLQEAVQRTDNITQDLLHELELASLNGVEMTKVAKQLKAVRQERRKYKDELAKVNTLKRFTDKYNNKLIVGDILKVLKDIEVLEENQKTRIYKAKVLKDLKCAEYSKEGELNK